MKFSRSWLPLCWLVLISSLLFLSTGTSSAVALRLLKKRGVTSSVEAQRLSRSRKFVLPFYLPPQSLHCQFFQLRPTPVNRWSDINCTLFHRCECSGPNCPWSTPWPTKIMALIFFSSRPWLQLILITPSDFVECVDSRGLGLVSHLLHRRVSDAFMQMLRPEATKTIWTVWNEHSFFFVYLIWGIT